MPPRCCWSRCLARPPPGGSAPPPIGRFSSFAVHAGFLNKPEVFMRKAVWIAVATAFLALPVSAADNVIYRGVDLWDTTNDGSTYMDFARKPIPAGFFCRNSEPFTGRVALRGVSIASSRPGELGAVDTIVERLDDAAFNKQGIATTRIQVRALQLESLAPLKT